MKQFVIGDIHGSYMELVDLINKVNPDLYRDQIIFLGDYIDRGFHSYHVIQLLIGIQKEYGKDHVILLRGNHEQMAIDNIKRNYRGSSNGYDKTVLDFERNGDSIDNYIGFFNSLPYYYEDKNFIFVHGGIRPGVSMKNQIDDDLLWIREEFFQSSITFDKRIIFGHTPTKFINGQWEPFIKDDRIGIDTGCVYGGGLTGIEINEGKIVKIHKNEKLAA